MIFFNNIAFIKKNTHKTLKMPYNKHINIQKLTFTLFFINITFTPAQYIGEEIENIPYGYGQMTYENGDVYQGEFYNGSKNGFGIMTYANKLEYSGDWVNNMREGYGVLKNLLLENKNPKITEMYKSVWHLLNENAIYYGEWKNDMYHGLGVKANVTCNDVDIANCVMPKYDRNLGFGQMDHGCSNVDRNGNYAVDRNGKYAVKINVNDMEKFDFYFGVFRKNKIETDQTRLCHILTTHASILNPKSGAKSLNQYELSRSVTELSISFEYKLHHVSGYANQLVHKSYAMHKIFKVNVNKESCKKISDYVLFEETTWFLYNLKTKKKNVVKNVKKQMLISKYKKDLKKQLIDAMDISEKVNLLSNIRINVCEENINDFKKELKKNNMSSIALICILVGVFAKYIFNKCKNYFIVSKNKRDLKKEIKNLKKDFSKFKKENKDLKKENENLKDILRI